MKASAKMESLWQYIQSLSLSDRNKKWLAEKLVEDTKADDTGYISKEEILAGIDAGLKDMKAGRGKPFEEFMKEWEDEVQH
ncbi:MAG: surface protein [Bacteroides sp.]|nr:surface protein [Bacteroides sp.]